MVQTIRIIAFILFASRFMYWIVAARSAEKSIPKNKNVSLRKKMSRIFTLSLEIVIAAQLVGLSIFPLEQHMVIGAEITGIILLLSGTMIMIVARFQLGANWVTGEDYQIKEKQDLVTHGIYSSIRHPIYAGVILSYVGAELVAGSWLWVSMSCLIIPIIFQCKREERIFLAHFGATYTNYMQRTKMLIPHIF